jgi:hypothetical protein
MIKGTTIALISRIREKANRFNYPRAREGVGASAGDAYIFLSIIRSKLSLLHRNQRFHRLCQVFGRLLFFFGVLNLRTADNLTKPLLITIKYRMQIPKF